MFTQDMLTSSDSDKLPVLFEQLLSVVTFAIKPPKFGCVDAKPLTSAGKMTQVHFHDDIHQLPSSFAKLLVCGRELLGKAVFF